MRYLRWVMKLGVLMMGAPIHAADGPILSVRSLIEKQAAGSNGGSAVAIAREGAQAKISFSGTLQSAEAVSGPWTDVTNSASPYYTSLSGGPRFYRTRQSDSIFSARSVVALTMTGPFQRHFDLAFAGTPDGIFPPKREKPYFDGTLQMTGFDVPVSMRVRGNSSLQECPFPKLKFKVSREDRAGTPFFDAREVKLGTHCAEGGRGNIGRLRDERAGFREALAYEVMELLGFISPRVRRASVEYQDTTSTNDNPMAGWQMTRQGLILDDIEVVAERMGGRALADEEIAALTEADFDAQLITDLQFLHALLGNWDYSLALDGQGVWNTDVIELANGHLLPVAGDFDLASWVTEVVRLSAPHEYHPELSEVERQARYEIEQIQQRVSPASFAAARDRFLLQKAAIDSQTKAAQIDKAGRSNAVRHVTAFFECLD